MTEVSVRELKNHLSEYLRRVQAGEELTVLSRGRPVGRLLGPARDTASETNRHIERLRAQPWLRPGQGGQVSGAAQPVKLSEGTSHELLDDVRSP